MSTIRVSVILENADGLAWLSRQNHQTRVKPNSCIDIKIDVLSMEERAKVMTMVSENKMVYVRTTDNEEVLDVGVDEVIEKEKLLVREVLEKLVENVEGLNVTQLQKKLDDLMEKLEKVDVTDVTRVVENLNVREVLEKLVENVQGFNVTQLQKKLDDLMENVEGLNVTQLQKKLDDLMEKLEKVDVTDVTRVVENLNVREVLEKLVENVQGFNVTRLPKKLDDLMENVEGLNVTQLRKKLDDLMEKLKKVDVTRVIENLNGIEEGGGIDIKKYIIFCAIAFAGYALGRCGNKASFTLGCQFLAAVDLKAIKDFFKPAIKSAFEVFKKEVGRTLLNKLSLS